MTSNSTIVRVGVIADTHGILHPQVPRVFEGVDKIIHAGDVGGLHILEHLRKIAPVQAVRGNYDPEPSDQLLEDPTGIELAGHKVLLTHRLLAFVWEESRSLIEQMISRFPDPPRIVIFGHTHVPIAEEIRGVFFINPGYAGPDPYEADYTLGLLEIRGNDITGKIITLDREGLE